MLDDLNKIDWKNLQHAYGSAADIPNDLKDLTSIDKNTRKKAINNLQKNVFHQGTRYQATVYTIPFLYELIQSEFTRDKHEIILLLINFAFGYEEEYLPDGFAIESYKTELKQITESENPDSYDYVDDLKILINCYEAVKDNILIVKKYFKSSDKKTREASLYAISWFPEYANELLNEIIDHLNTVDDEIEIANTILSIGFILKQLKKTIDLSFIRNYLNNDSKLVRACSLIALAQNTTDKKILHDLNTKVKSDNDFNHVEGILFNNGQICQYAGMILQ